MSTPAEGLGFQLGQMTAGLVAAVEQMAAGIARGRAAFEEAQREERARLERRQAEHTAWLATPEGELAQMRQRIAGKEPSVQVAMVADHFTARAHRELGELLERITKNDQASTVLAENTEES